MKPKFFTLALLFVVSLSTKAQISGAVYRDYNNNGSRETANPSEPLASGIIINVYSTSDVLLATTTSAGTAAPNYSFPASGPNSVANGVAVRMEFVIPAAFGAGNPSSKGTSGNNAVRFVTGGAAAVNINFGISNNKEQFSTTVPLAVSNNVYQNFLTATDYSVKAVPYNYLADKDGNINSTGGSNNWNVTGSNGFGNPNNGTGQPTGGTRPAPTNIALNSQIGTTYGLAWKSQTRELFAGAFVKRKAYISAQGPGAIWKMTNPTGPVTPTLYVNLNTVFANAFGVDPRTGAGSPPAPISGWNDDREIIPFVAKRGIGDIDINNSEDTIYVINLQNRQLYAVPTSGALNSSTIKSYNFLSSVSSLTGVSSFTNADIRPFGLGRNPRNNFMYIGATYTAQTSQNQADLRALVFRYDPTNASFTLVLNQSISYNRSDAGINTNTSYIAYKPWQDAVCELSGAGCSGASDPRANAFPMPILSDIVFDGDVMVLGFRDRFGDLTPNANAGAAAGNDPYSRGYGEILRAHLVSGSYIFESNGSSIDGNTASSINSGVNTGGAGGIANGGGPGGGEFYFQDWTGDGGLWEATQGALFMNPGSNEVVTTCYDAVAVGTNGNKTTTNYNTNGFQKYSNVNGQYVGAYDVYEGSDLHNFAKCNGLGDIEALFSALPIEAGNKIWNDTDGDGIQDANEPGLGGVELELLNGVPSVIASVTSAANGSFFFSSLTGTNVTGIAYNVNLQPNTSYTLRVKGTVTASNTITGNTGLGASNYLTLSNINGNGQADWSDNDAIKTGGTGGTYQATFTTGAYGQNNNTLDIGFSPINVLPVKIESFTAALYQGNVQLNWIISEEINTAAYHVEYSNNGINFSDIGIKAASGSLNYSIIHSSVPATGIGYYRLKVLDKDGKYVYSEIKRVNFGKAGTVSVYPNPAKDVVNVTFSNNTINQPAQIILLSVDGKVVVQRNLSAISQTEAIDISNLSSGKYILRVVTETETINRTINVIK